MTFSYLRDTMTFSGATAGSKTLALPRTRVDSLICHMQVTAFGSFDACTFYEFVDRVSLSNGADAWFDCFSGHELLEFISIRDPSLTDGAYSNPALSPGQQMDVYFILKGPFRLQDGADPQLFIQLKDPTTVTGVTGLSVTVKVGMQTAGTSGIGFTYRRTALQPDTRHTLANPMLSLADRVTGCVISSQPEPLAKVSMAQNQNASTTNREYAVYCDDPYFYFAMLCDRKERDASAMEGYSYLISGFQNINGPGQMVLEYDNPTAVVAWVEGVRS